jgi:hypothetical protein
MSEREKSVHHRKHPRRALLEPVIFVVGAPKSGVVAIDAETLNVSTGGACIVSNRDQTTGSIMRIKLPHPGTDIHVPRLAEVRWVAPANGRYKMGLRFVV